jgi:hypothetical protein
MDDQRHQDGQQINKVDTEEKVIDHAIHNINNPNDNTGKTNIFEPSSPIAFDPAAYHRLPKKTKVETRKLSAQIRSDLDPANAPEAPVTLQYTKTKPCHWQYFSISTLTYWLDSRNSDALLINKPRSLP